MSAHNTLTLAAVALLLAGCTQPSPPPTAPKDEGPQTTDIPFEFPRRAGSTPPGGTFEVLAGATRIAVDATWTCSAAPCGMDMVVQNTTGAARATTPGNGSAHAEVADGLEVGTWGVTMFARSEGVQAQGSVRVVVSR